MADMVGLGKVVHRLGRGVADRFYWPVLAAENFPDGNQFAALTRAGTTSAEKTASQPGQEAEHENQD